MARKAPGLDSLKLLYATSGNQCAFPECVHPIFNDDGLYVAQLCHIEAANENGPRFNESQSDDDRRSISNLLFMCHRHHKETDDVDKYDVSTLKVIKEKHEGKFLEKNVIASANMIRQIGTEISYFWNKQKTKTFDLKDLKIELDFDKEILDLFAELESNIERIRDYCDMTADSDDDLYKETIDVFKKYGVNTQLVEKIPYYENPLISRNWEMHNIGRPNLFTHLTLCLNQLKVKVLDNILKSNPEDKKIKGLIDKVRNEFEANYDDAYYVD